MTQPKRNTRDSVAVFSCRAFGLHVRQIRVPRNHELFMPCILNLDLINHIIIDLILCRSQGHDTNSKRLENLGRVRTLDPMPMPLPEPVVGS